MRKFIAVADRWEFAWKMRRARPKAAAIPFCFEYRAFHPAWKATSRPFPLPFSNG
jgi:hypothetical protein